jgi:hypothetical protein
MIRKCLLIAATGLTCLVAQGSAWASRYFYVYNNTNSGTIVGLWASPHNSNNWEDNFIKYSSQEIGQGQYNKMFWYQTRPEQWFDLRVQFDDGRTEQWTESPFDLHTVTDIYLSERRDGDLQATTD